MSRDYYSLFELVSATDSVQSISAKILYTILTITAFIPQEVLFFNSVNHVVFIVY